MDINLDVKTLAEKARNKTLHPSEFVVCNVEMYRDVLPFGLLLKFSFLPLLPLKSLSTSMEVTLPSNQRYIGFYDAYSCQKILLNQTLLF